MGIPTEIYVRTIRATSRGSDWYGLCEVCKQHASSIEQTQKHRVWQTETGEFYLSPIGGGAYGHAGCLIKAYGDLLADSQFVRKYKLKTVSKEQFEKLKAAHGIGEKK